MNYTKGEWKVNCGIRANGELIATTEALKRNLTKDGYNATEEIANARLISAAPEMYEALQKISYAVMNGNLKVNKSVAIQIYEIATPALAKAEGKEGK